MSLDSVLQLCGVFRKLKVGLGRKLCSRDGFLFSVFEVILRAVAASEPGVPGNAPAPYTVRLGRQHFMPSTLRLQGHPVKQTESGWYGKEALPGQRGWKPGEFVGS